MPDSHKSAKQDAVNELRQDAISSKRAIRSLRTKADQKRSLPEKFADWMSEVFGSIWFLIFNIVWFGVWLVVNTKIIPGIEPFDPFPFGLLTTIVSLEAIMLAIFVLISQNRAEKIDELRAEIDLQIDMIAEEELTKLLTMVSLLLEKHGIDPAQDQDLQEMVAPTNVEKLEEVLEEQIINKTEKSAK